MAIYLDDKKLGGIKELCEALKISTNEIPYLKRTKEFEMTMERDIHGNPKRDRDGNYETKRKISGKPEYSVFAEKLGYEVRIRLASTQRKDKEDYIYTPTNITLDPAEDGSVQINDNLEFAFWYLHPWNLQSPFHRKGSPAFFEYKDHDAKSKIENDHEEDMINAIGYVVGNNSKSIKQLRSIAKGLNVDGVDDMTDEVVKKRLRDIAKANPTDFISKVESRETVFFGQVQDAIDKKILETRNLNGMVRWYLNGKEILPVTFGMDAITELKNELSAKWYLYADEIKSSLAGVDIAENLNKAEHDEVFTPETVVHKLVQTADMSPELKAVLKKMEEESWYEEKIKKLAAIDPTDTTVHQATRKSYEANKEAVELYKASLLAEEVV